MLNCIGTLRLVKLFCSNLRGPPPVLGGRWRLGPKHDGASTNRRCAFPAHHPEQESLRIPPAHQSLTVFPCRKLPVQKDLERVCFDLTGLERHGGMVVAAVVSIRRQRRKESGRLGKNLIRLHATLVAGGGLTGSAWSSSEGGHTR